MKKQLSKAKQWIKKLLGTDPRELDPDYRTGSSPARRGSPVAPIPRTMAPAEPPISNDPSFALRSQSPPHSRIETTLTEVLRQRIYSCALLQHSVEDEMKEMVTTFRESMPPSLIQLWVQTYSKKGPPAVLHWVRLCQKPDGFDPTTLGPRGTKLPRWSKTLKIRTRSDLSDALYLNGLGKHRKTAMSFYSRRVALNTSRSRLARTLHIATQGFNFSLNSSSAKRESIEHLLSRPGMEHIERHGTGPYCVAWQLGRLVERDLLALLELGRQTTDLPFRLILHPGKTQFDRKIEWEDRSSGRRYRYLKDRWLEKKASSNKDLEAMRAAVAQSRILVWDLSTRLEVLRNAESRLTEALLEANELLGQCSRVEKVPRVWGY